ncbi:MAG TPA: hypothetical protein VJ840_04340 [Gemmatimonadaceae bacterium]|nr:hypothetical protein [Gemmatimonadaceae bacterium]
MTPKVSNQTLMRRLLGASVAAADAEQFEVSYHALMAALHAAEIVGRDTGSVAPLDEIERVAKAQAAMVEKVKPPHQLSKSAAKNRGHNSVYETLLIHTKSARLRIEAEARRDNTVFRWPNVRYGEVSNG